MLDAAKQRELLRLAIRHEYRDLNIAIDDRKFFEVKTLAQRIHDYAIWITYCIVVPDGEDEPDSKPAAGTTRAKRKFIFDLDVGGPHQDVIDKLEKAATIKGLIVKAVRQYREEETHDRRKD